MLPISRYKIKQEIQEFNDAVCFRKLLGLAAVVSRGRAKKNRNGICRSLHSSEEGKFNYFILAFGTCFPLCLPRSILERHVISRGTSFDLMLYLYGFALKNSDMPGPELKLYKLCVYFCAEQGMNGFAICHFQYLI